MQETIELEGSVRSLTRRLITVANPLGRDKPITFPKGNAGDDLNPAAGGESEVKHADLANTNMETGTRQTPFASGAPTGDFRPIIKTTLLLSRRRTKILSGKHQGEFRVGQVCWHLSGNNGMTHTSAERAWN